MTPPLTREQIENLLKLAEKATHGPWTVDTCGDVISRSVVDTDTEECKAFGGPLFRMIGTTPTAPYNSDGIFIAASHPETIKSLCNEILRLREAFEVAKAGLLKINNWPLNERGERKLPVFSHLKIATTTLTRINSIMNEKGKTE